MTVTLHIEQIPHFDKSIRKIKMWYEDKDGNTHKYVVSTRFHHVDSCYYIKSKDGFIAEHKLAAYLPDVLHNQLRKFLIGK